MTTLTFDSLVRRNVPLAGHSSYEIGGVASWFASPETLEELVYVLEAGREKGLDPFLFGMGTNLLFPDQPGATTLYVTLKNMTGCSVRNGRLFVSAGTPLALLALAGCAAGVSDYEFTHLLPGCFGAGVFINAKYGDGQIENIVESVQYIDLSRDKPAVESIAAADCGFSYKQSVFQHKPWFIVGAELKGIEHAERLDEELTAMLGRWLTHRDSASSLPAFYAFISGEAAELEKKGVELPGRMKEIHRYRTEKRHFEYPSCGSVFKNNYSFGRPVGALVDELQMKGLAHGGAAISPYHGNMIINTGGAKAADVLHLIYKVTEAVEKAYGFAPEPEVEIVRK